jgi:hypothetical protein
MDMNIDNIMAVSRSNKFKNAIFETLNFMIEDDFSLSDKDLWHITTSNVLSLEQSYMIYNFSFEIAEFLPKLYPNLEKFCKPLSKPEIFSLERDPKFIRYRKKLDLDRLEGSTLPFISLCMALHKKEIIELANSHCEKKSA